MARPPLLTLADISLTFGGDPLFDGLALAVHEGARAALVGRNGSGKSTLMKMIAGHVEPDSGTRFVRPGTHVAYMEQDPELAGHATLGDFARAGLAAADFHKVDAALDGLGLDPARDAARASGGERRRAALARLIAEEADLMLLDEPTNHLDITAILWLERYLASTRSAFVLISHDRAFLSALTRETIWVDRGQVRQQGRGFDGFESWRDKIYEEEDAARHKRDRLIKAESRWAVEGISARRKRNMGRVRRLQDLRAERAAAIRRSGTAGLALEAGTKSGKLVIEAQGLQKSFDGRPVVRDLDLRVMRGDRIGIVGPNGVGKTTLLGLLTGQIPPDTGTVRHGTNLEIAIFDQTRASLDPDASLWDSLTHDPALGVAGRNDQVMVRGVPRHVAGYLKDFLFGEEQFRAPVRSLSGGEKARLLMARIMARESNLLILDEPTNDLDVETLDLLEEVLDAYSGTVLLVSHDRDFCDRVVTMTLAMEGDGVLVSHAGGYSDYLARKAAADPGQTAKSKLKSGGGKPAQAPRPAAPKAALSYTESHRLESLPGEIDQLGAEIEKLETLLAQPGLFEKDPAKFAKASAALAQRQETLEAAEEEWLELAAKAEGEG